MQQVATQKLDDLSSAASDASSVSLFNLLVGPWLEDNLDVSWIRESLRNLQLFMVMFDYLYRAFISIKTVRKYFSKSTCQAPVIDIRERGLFCSSSNRNFLPEMPPKIQVLLMWLYYTWFYVLIGLVFVFVVLYTSITTYIPLFNSYVSSCVNHDTIASSENVTRTFLSRNLNSIAFNYASMSGNREISESLGEYNFRSASHCSEQHTASSPNYLTDQRTFLDSTALHEKYIRDSDFIRGCVDYKSMDHLFATACNSSASEATSLICPQSFRGDANALSFGDFYPQTERLELENSYFNCSALPVCSFTCSGPHVAGDLLSNNETNSLFLIVKHVAVVQ